MKQRRIVLLLLLLLVFAGCGNANQNTVNENINDTSDVSDELLYDDTSTEGEASPEDYLEQYSGWWLAEDYNNTSEFLKTYPVFYIDDTAMTWTSYNKAGFLLEKGTISLSEDGMNSLVLQLSDGSTAEFEPYENTELQMHGENSFYEMCNSMEGMSQYSGIWHVYNYGLKTTLYLQDDATYEIYCDDENSTDSKGELLESGTYSTLLYSTYTAESVYDSIEIYLDNGSGIPNGLVVAADGNALLDRGMDDAFYLREENASATENNAAYTFCKVALNTWYCEESDHYIQGNEMGEISYMELGSDHALTKILGGNITQEDQAATITWEDGTEDVVSFLDEETFTLSTRGETYRIE